MTLYNAISQLKQDIDAIRIAHPELADDPDFASEVFDAETDFNSILSKLVDMALDAATKAEAMKVRVGELRARQDRHELKDERLRALILTIMERAGLPKAILTEATLSIRHIPPSPIINDETLLPDDCVKLIRKPDISAIKARMAGGGSIPGVAMSNGRSSLTVRTK